MKIIYITLALILLLACSAFLCSCAYIETTRFAEIDRANSSIFFEVSGFYMAPLTPEGPFPHWSNRLKVNMIPDHKIPVTGSSLFSARKDFESQYGEAESGTIFIDKDKKLIEIQVNYSESYSWNRVKGKFPIKVDK